MRYTAALLLAVALVRAPAVAGFFPDGAFTDDARGLCSAQFLKVPPSARFAALAGAGLTLESRDSFFLNPAAAASHGAAAAASYEALLEGTARTGLVFARSAGAATFSAGLIYQDASAGLLVLDGAGSGDGSEAAAYDAAAGLGWARRLHWGSLGVNAKYVRSRLAEASGATAALDAGVLLRDPSRPATELAVALRNFGPPLKQGSVKAPLPAEISGGLKWKYARDFNIFLEGRMPADHSPYLILAGEWFVGSSPSSGLFLRSGLNFRNYEDHGFMGAFGGGFGLKLGGFTADYAFSPYGELGAAHRMTLGLAWGAHQPPVKPPVSALPAAGALLAVAPFSSSPGVTEVEAAVSRNLVESELSKTGRFTVADRTGLNFILEEKKLSYSGLSDEKAATSLGGAVGAELAVFGTVGKNAAGYSINIGLLRVVSGEILRRGDAQAEEDYLLREAARSAVAELLAGDLPDAEKTAGLNGGNSAAQSSSGPGGLSAAAGAVVKGVMNSRIKNVDVYVRQDVDTSDSRIVVFPMLLTDGTKLKPADTASSNLLIDAFIVKKWSEFLGGANTLSVPRPALDNIPGAYAGIDSLVSSLDSVSAVEQTAQLTGLLENVSRQIGDGAFAFALLFESRKDYESSKQLHLNMGLFDTKKLTWKWITKDSYKSKLIPVPYEVAVQGLIKESIEALKSGNSGKVR